MVSKTLTLNIWFKKARTCDFKGKKLGFLKYGFKSPDSVKKSIVLMTSGPN